MGFQILLQRDTGETVKCGLPLQDLSYAINKAWQIFHVFGEIDDAVEIVGNELDVGYRTVLDEFFGVDLL